MHLNYYKKVAKDKESSLGGRSYTYRKDDVSELRTEFVVETANEELHRVVPFFKVDTTNYSITKDIVYLGEPIYAPDEKKD